VSGLFERLTGFEFLSPTLLALVLLVPVAIWIGRRGRAPAAIFSPAALFGASAPLPRSWRTRLLPLPVIVQAVALALVVVALARPVERAELPMQSDGIDILLAVDTSSSMTVVDMADTRSRLDVAKAAAARFVARRNDDRIGLISFARYPDVLCPVTLDHDALTTLLAAVGTVESDGPEDATGIGTAVARAAQVLEGSAAASKVVILLTDGEENVAAADKPEEIAPLHAGQLCERLGVRVYTIAAGVERRNPDGTTTALDTSQVEDLSRRTGGRFFQARSAADVDAVYAEIDALETAALDAPRFRLEERFARFLIAGLLLLVTGVLLESTILRVIP